MEYKLTLYNLSDNTSPQALAEGIMDNYGEDFDAGLGDFTAKRVDDLVEVIAKNVAAGDVRVLREDIYRDFGDEDETMMIRASYGEGGQWFATDLEDD